MVKRALVALRKVTPSVLGAVLNVVDVKSKAYYGYGYYGSRRERQASDERRAKDAAAEATAAPDAEPAVEVSDAPPT